MQPPTSRRASASAPEPVFRPDGAGEKERNDTHVDNEAQVSLESDVSGVVGEVDVDCVTNERYVSCHSGNQRLASSFFFIGDLGSSQSLPTDVTATYRGEPCTALSGRSDSSDQAARRIFPSLDPGPNPSPNASPGPNPGAREAFWQPLQTSAGGRAMAVAERMQGRRPVKVSLAILVSLALVAGLAFSSPAAADEYEVQAGDTLWSIAVEHETTVGELQELNDLEGSLLRVGQLLALPGAPYEGPVVEHQVEEKEALSLIAERYDVEIEAILELNGITDPNRIRIGQVLKIPARAIDKGDEVTITVRHRIATGESLGSIGEDFDVTIATIMLANEITNPNLIRVGDVLEIPHVVPRNDTERMSALFERWAETNDLDPELLKAIGWQESRWQDDALSSAGAMGVGQIMPGTATYISRDLIGDPDLDVWNASDNIEMSARYVRYLLEQTDGDLRLALASYYQGWGSVQRRGLYGETEDYVASVLRFRDQFLEGSLPPVPR